MTAYKAALTSLSWDPAIGQSLVPALIGPTGCGKTMLARDLGKDLKLVIRTLLLGTALPEDVLGLPEIKDGVTKYTMPDWAITACSEPTLLHLDEIDKARPEVLATVLTLISDRRVRDHDLHPQTKIILSGQPVEDYWLQEQSAMAISARVIWLKLDYDFQEIERLGGISLSWAPRPATTVAPVLPVPSARQLLYLAQLRNAGHEQKIVSMIAEGVIPKALVPEFLTAPETAHVDTTSYEVMDLKKAAEYLDSISPSHILALLDIPNLEPRRIAMAIASLAKIADNDLAKSCRQRVADAITPKVASYLTITDDPHTMAKMESDPPAMSPPVVSRGEYGVVVGDRFLM